MNSVPTAAIYLFGSNVHQDCNPGADCFSKLMTQCLTAAYQRALDARLYLLENRCNSFWREAQSEAVSLLADKPPQN